MDPGSQAKKRPKAPCGVDILGLFLKPLGGIFLPAQDSDELKLAAGSYSRRVAEPEAEEDAAVCAVRTLPRFSPLPWSLTRGSCCSFVPSSFQG